MRGSIVIGVAALALLAGRSGAEDLRPPIAGEVLGAEIRTTDAEELRYEILRRLTRRYAEEHAISVTAAERKAYVEHLRAGLARDRAEKEARREEIDRRLAASGVPEAERAALAEERESVETLLAALGHPATESAEDRAARDEIASAFILQWKIHRELYRQYGGRIGYQQGGPEPLDAIRKFLEERQAKADFQILDRTLETAFWRYYRDDSLHSFYAPGSREEAKAFATPPWQTH